MPGEYGWTGKQLKEEWGVANLGKIRDNFF